MRALDPMDRGPQRPLCFLGTDAGQPAVTRLVLLLPLLGLGGDPGDSRVRACGGKRAVLWSVGEQLILSLERWLFQR